MAKQLTDYYCVQACRNMQDPTNIKVLRQFQVTLDGTSPADTYRYDRHHDLTHVCLWGTNLDQLKKLARYLLLTPAPEDKPTSFVFELGFQPSQNVSFRTA